jgi:hypothetical protein
MNITVASWNTDVLAVQNGTEVYRGSVLIPYYNVIEPDATGKFYTKFTAQGTAGSEIGYVYILNNDGTYGTRYTQATVPAAGSFTYSTGTKEIVFFSGEEPEANTRIACAYSFMSADNASQIVINSDGVPPTVIASAYGLAKDVCTGELFECVVTGQAQVDGNWTFDLAADGEPAIQNLSLEFVKGCVDKKLYEFIVYTEDEADANKVETPVASPVGGSYASAQTVTLSVATSGATLYYTLNGTDPTVASTTYSTPIAIPAGATTILKVIGIAPDMNDSDVLMETYVISQAKAATPVAAPAGGSYTEEQTVTLTSESGDATIYYTTDGATPTSSSTQYSAAVTIPTGATTNLKAIAIESGLLDSNIMDETYVIS